MTDWFVHCCVVSYKRRSLTEATVESFLATVSLPHSLVIVDNGSPPDVTDWLGTLDVPVVLLGENRYPGYATNRGWEQAPVEATLLQASDNDARYLPGWCDEMIETFEARPEVVQYGVIAAGDEEWTSIPSWPVAGNSIVRRELYERGLRYSEKPWTDDPNAVQQEAQFTLDVHALSYEHAFGTRPGVVYLDDGDEEYLRESNGVRGLAPERNYPPREFVPPDR